MIAADFNVVNMEVKPSTIEITGAKSVIESISFVKATVSGEEGINKSFEQQSNIRVLDKDLNKLDVSIVPEHVTVKVEIEENNKEIPIVIKAKGTPPDGVVIDKISTVVETIKLYGPSRILNEINEFVIEVDVSKVDGPSTIDVDLKKPKGVSEISFTKIKVDIEATVEIPEPDDEVTTEEPVDEDIASIETIKFENMEITVIGLDQKFKSTLLKPESGLFTLTIMAETGVAENLVAADFTVSIDASETAIEGEQVYPVTVKGPTNIQWTLSEDEVTMRIELV